MGLGKLWAEFKAFAFQGNMIDLAVAVVIGGAFGGVIHSLVGDVIMPTVAYLIHEGESVAEKTKEVAETAANKVGVATSQPTTAPTTQATATADATAPPAVPAAASPDEARKKRPKCWVRSHWRLPLLPPRLLPLPLQSPMTPSQCKSISRSAPCRSANSSPS